MTGQKKNKDIEQTAQDTIIPPIEQDDGPVISSNVVGLPGGEPVSQVHEDSVVTPDESGSPYREQTNEPSIASSQEAPAQGATISPTAEEDAPSTSATNNENARVRSTERPLAA